MDYFSASFLSSLFSIVVIDLVLAGDNALVIGMAARNIPKDQQKTAIVWGTIGAVAIRALATLVVVWLLKLPGLLAVGGIVLIWISYKILTEKSSHEHIHAESSLGAAIRTIIIADAAMGIDNVLAVAGAAHGNFGLVILGLAISIPIVVWGSTLFIRLLDRIPLLIYVGAGVLAYTAAKMLVDEPLWHSLLGNTPLLSWLIIIAIVCTVIGLGFMKRRSDGSR